MAPSLASLLLAAAAVVFLASCATPQKPKKERASTPTSPSPRGKAPKGDTARFDSPRPSVMDPEIPDPMAIGTYSVTRQISMFYRLDLLRDNEHSKDMAAIMHIYDAPVRACYVERLDDQPWLKGDVDLSFAMSKQSGGMEKIRHVGGTLRDPALVQCLKRRLAEIPFQPPRDMRGKLRYRFESSSPGAAKLTPLRVQEGR
jgi:hypothetical protein